MILRLLYNLYFFGAICLTLLSVSELLFGESKIVKKLKLVPSRAIAIFLWPLMLFSKGGRERLFRNLNSLI